MSTEKIINELNIAIPYFIFYQAILIIMLTVFSIIYFYVDFKLLIYVFSFAASAILIKSAIELKKQKRSGIILLCVYLALLLIFPIIRPIYDYSLRYINDIVFFLIAIFLFLTCWNKWSVKPIDK